MYIHTILELSKLSYILVENKFIVVTLKNTTQQTLFHLFLMMSEAIKSVLVFQICFYKVH